VTGPDITMPLYQNEDRYLPDSEGIADAVRAVHAYGFSED